MEQLAVDVENRLEDLYYYQLISQDFSHLTPIENFAPGCIEQLLYCVYVFKIKKDLKKNGLPKLPRKVREGNESLSFKVNGPETPTIFQDKVIVKRTLTAPDKPYSLWEYLLDSNDTWTILHHYAQKEQKRKRPREYDIDPVQTVLPETVAEQTAIEPSPNDYQIDFSIDGVLFEPMQEFLEVNSQTIPAERMHIMPEEDSLLPNIPIYLYYKLLNESIAEKTFFNHRITIHEDLFKFKVVQDVDRPEHERETKIYVGLRDLTDNNFEFIVQCKFIHIVSPAGTGKTMALWQLAKSFELDHENIVTVMSKAEFYWHEVKRSTSMDARIVNSSMMTADIRDHSMQQEWHENLFRTIQQGAGVILLLDAVDEMKSQEQEELLHHIEELTRCIPGCFGDVNIIALVVSSRPGISMPESEEIEWTALKIAKVKDSDNVLRTLCGSNVDAFERAKSLQLNFKLPRTLFWYSLLAIDVQTIDPTRPMASSQFDFLSGLLLQSIKVTQLKRESLDDDQREFLGEDPTVLLQVAALVAYLAKMLGTTAISEIEEYLPSLLTEASFPASVCRASGSIVNRLLPFYQFCHCCYSCSEDSLDKFIKFDHQIIWDYLAADFIVKTIVKKNYASLLAQLDNYQAIKFDWRKCVESTALPYSEWAQTLHLVADALPVTQFAATLKGCDEQQCIAWITAVLNHPRCRDVSNPSLVYVKLFVSCLFNASSKNVSQPMHQRKKFKDTIERDDDDQLTATGFDLVFKLFRQPIIGQLLLDEICQYKPLSLLLNELKLRNRDQAWLELLTEKFDVNENRLPDELISLVKQLRDSDTQFLCERLFYRLSSKCAEELVSHPVRRAIHYIFVYVFKEERCADFLIEKLANMEDVCVQASAMTVLASFQSLSLGRIKRMIGMIEPVEKEQRVIYALPRELPFEVFDDLKHLALECESELWSQIFRAFERIVEETQQCWDSFFELFDDYKTYLIAKRKLALKSYVKLSTEQIEKLTIIYCDPAAFYQRTLDNMAIDSVRRATRETVKLQELTEAQKKLFDLLPKPKSYPPRRIRVGGNPPKYYEAATIDDYMQSFCSGPITHEQVVLLKQYYLPHYVTTVEPAFQLLDHVAAQFQLVTGHITGENLLSNDAIYRTFISRSDYHLVAADGIIYILNYRIVHDNCAFDNTHLSRLLPFIQFAVNLRMGVRDDWHTLDMRQCEELFLALTARETPIKWSVDNMVTLWQLIGSVHYQHYAARAQQKFFPDVIPDMLANWTQEDVDAFLATVADLECASKLQHEVEKCIANLLT